MWKTQILYQKVLEHICFTLTLQKLLKQSRKYGNHKGGKQIIKGKFHKFDYVKMKTLHGKRWINKLYIYIQKINNRPKETVATYMIKCLSPISRRDNKFLEKCNNPAENFREEEIKMFNK